MLSFLCREKIDHVTREHLILPVERITCQFVVNMESGRLCLHEEQESVYSAEDDVSSFVEKKWRIKFHVIFLFIYVVTFTATVCAMSLSSGPPPKTTDMNDINKVYLTIPPNDTLACRPFHRFALSEELYISVCADKRPTRYNTLTENRGCVLRF